MSRKVFDTYKYYAGITSQIPFCATPLRLDSYNKCQFGCAYCFARTRQGFGRDEDLKVSDPKSLEERLHRVAKGEINSALDEFIEKRIPFQLGGMSDPFSEIEKKQKVSFNYIKILKKYDYPFIVSTKSCLISTDEYLDVLRGSNSYIRFSTTVINDSDRQAVDKGCPSIVNLAKSAEIIAHAGIPVSFRFQPMIPGHEDAAFRLLDIAKDAGVRHVSAEYLKVPIDANKKFGSGLIKLLDNNPINYYKNLGAIRWGREYLLPLSYRQRFLPEIYRCAKAKKMTFGFADNDLLVHSDGKSCCNASNLYLRNAAFFNANIVSIAKDKKEGEKIFFGDYLEKWFPKKSVSTYLNSKSRLSTECLDEDQWVSFLRALWLGKHGIYSPDHFDGVEKTDMKDDLDLPVFMRVTTNFQKSLGEKN